MTAAYFNQEKVEVLTWVDDVLFSASDSRKTDSRSLNEVVSDISCKDSNAAQQSSQPGQVHVNPFFLLARDFAG